MVSPCLFSSLLHSSHLKQPPHQRYHHRQAHLLQLRLLAGQLQAVSLHSQQHLNLVDLKCNNRHINSSSKLMLATALLASMCW
jgi:hypothetical protein